MQMTIFDTEEYQPRFQAYLDHVGATHHSEVNIRHFIAWISRHADDFKRVQNIETIRGRHDEFTNYVWEQVRG